MLSRNATEILIDREIHCASLLSLKEFADFFLLHYKKEVSVSDRMEFVNGWYIMLIISDILTIIGSILKMEIQAKVTFFPNYSIAIITFALIAIYFSRW